jgi:autotransporter-associated beta strand protein
MIPARNRTCFLLGLCLILGAAVSTAVAHDWDNGNGNYNWFDPVNWNPNSLPSSSAAAIDTACDPSHYVTINSGSSAYCYGLTLGASAGNNGYLFEGSGALYPYDEYIGRAGTGTVLQTGGENNNYATGTSYDLMLGYSDGGVGTYYLQGGTVSTHHVYVGRDGTGYFYQTGGTLQIGHASNSDGLRHLRIGYATSGVDGVGTYRLASTGQLVLANADGNIYVGDHYGSSYFGGGRFEWFRSGGITIGGSGGSGKMVLDSGLNSNTLAMGYDYNIANLQGGGLVPIENLANSTLETTNSATATVVAGNSVSQYYYRTGTVGLAGTTSMTGGSLAVNDEYVGYGGTGTFNQSAGSHTAYWHLYVGAPDGDSRAGAGTYNLSGGTLADGYLAVGTDLAGSGGPGLIVQSGNSRHDTTNNVFLGNTASGCTGTYKILAGTWNVGGSVSGPSNGTIIINGGTISVGASINVKNFTLGDTSGYNGAFTLAAAKSLTATNETIGQGGTGAFTQNGGANNVTNLTIGNGSSYTLSGGSLTAGPVVVGQGGAATFDIGAQSPSVSSLTLKNGTVTGTTGTITATSGYLVESGSVSAKLAGGVALTKQTGGTVTLTGANSYGGDTNVTAGTLLVDGTLDSSGTAVTVNNGAVLGGTGTISRSLNTSSGSTVSPGDNGIGTLTLRAQGIVTLNGILLIDVSGAGAGSCDLLDVSGGLTGALDISREAVQFNVLSALNDPAYVFAKYGSLNGTFSGVTNLPAGYTIDYSYAGNQIALVSVPEPSTFILLGIGALGLLTYAWRRRRV